MKYIVTWQPEIADAGSMCNFIKATDPEVVW